MADAKMEDVSFLEDAAGQGFEGMTSGEVATPLLLISQAMSTSVQNGDIPQGHFYNSVTGKDYGESVDVIVCHFEKMWYEWKPNQGGLVGRYPVGGLEGVTGDVYTGLKHGENDVLETWLYIVVLPNHLEDGFLVFSSTRGNLRYLKAWNTQMKYLRLPSGKPAPLFAAVWNMTLGKDANKQGKQYYSCNANGKSSIHQNGWVTKVVFDDYVTPARQIADNTVAKIDTQQVNALEDESGSETSDDVNF